ncbi:MAG: hypothetical protein D6714_01125 [Bacteroidetes bacterium]|nr:MAG: hypothetical protein D6714_01125 [Bacteroidota bacterium]
MGSGIRCRKSMIEVKLGGKEIKCREPGPGFRSFIELSGPQLRQLFRHFFTFTSPHFNPICLNARFF